MVYFEIPRRHIPTKTKLEYPPPRMDHGWYNWRRFIGLLLFSIWSRDFKLSITFFVPIFLLQGIMEGEDPPAYMMDDIDDALGEVMNDFNKEAGEAGGHDNAVSKHADYAVSNYGFLVVWFGLVKVFINCLASDLMRCPFHKELIIWEKMSLVSADNTRFSFIMYWYWRV